MSPPDLSAGLSQAEAAALMVRLQAMEGDDLVGIAAEAWLAGVTFALTSMRQPPADDGVSND